MNSHISITHPMTLMRFCFFYLNFLHLDLSLFLCLFASLLSQFICLSMLVAVSLSLSFSLAFMLALSHLSLSVPLSLCLSLLSSLHLPSPTLILPSLQKYRLWALRAPSPVSLPLFLGSKSYQTFFIFPTDFLLFLRVPVKKGL